MELFLLWFHSDSKDEGGRGGEVWVVGVRSGQEFSLRIVFVMEESSPVLRKLPKGFGQRNCETVFVNQKESKSHFVVDHLGKAWCTCPRERVQAGRRPAGGANRRS
jgi:hypothetical protein